jgi:predicted lipoprotein with Yx(FWY)xxD motif
MRKMRLPVLVVLLAAGLAFAAQMPQGVQRQKADSGTMVLADAKGMTLYTYGKDEPGKVELQRAVRAFLAAADSPGRRAADERLDGDHTQGRFQTVGLQR